MKNIKKTLDIALYFLVGFIVLTILFSVLPIPGNYKLLTVMSGSMEPSIKTGSVVMVKPVKEYKKDDVITFSFSENNYITHRVSRIEEDGYITKGDANATEDIRKVKEDNIFGKVLFSVPWFGYLVVAAKKPIGLLIFLVVPAIYVIVSESYKIYKELRKRNA